MWNILVKVFSVCVFLFSSGSSVRRIPPNKLMSEKLFCLPRLSIEGIYRPCGGGPSLPDVPQDPHNTGRKRNGNIKWEIILLMLGNTVITWNILIFVPTALYSIGNIKVKLIGSPFREKWSHSVKPEDATQGPRWCRLRASQTKSCLTILGI